MATESVRLMLTDVSRELLEKAKAAKADAAQSGSDYDKGRHFALYEVMSLLVQQADAFGIGFDRTKTGSDTVSQYHLPVRRQFSDPRQCPEKFLLWFHHVSWDHKMKSGRTLWDELALHYQGGAEWVRSTRATWAKLANEIDPERHAAIAQKIAIQERDAVWWRDACLLYFQTFAKKPLPLGVEPPAKTLAEYKLKALEW